MKPLFIIILFSLVGCNNSPKNPNTAQKVEPFIETTNNYSTIHKVNIPEKVREYLNVQLPDWSIPDTSNYSQAWWSFYSIDQMPYFTTAYINDDDYPDHALLLIHSNSIKLVIILSSGESYTYWIDDSFKESYMGNDIQYGLFVETSGQMDYFMDGMDKNLTFYADAVILKELEFISRVYYWSEDKLNVSPLR